MFMSKRLARARYAARGFTLIELIFFIVVVSVGLTGILLVSNTVVKSGADPLVRKQSLAIAQSLLEEIVLKDYAKSADSTVLGFGAGGARNLYDCVEDYTDYATTAGIVDATGASVAGLSGYNIAPKVLVTKNFTLPGSAVPLLQVVVSVTSPQGTVFSLTGYRADY
jgi:MSHA pilin protein MshD